MSTGERPTVGWLAAIVEQELPDLRLLVTGARITRAQAATDASPADVRERLLTLSNGFRGARAIALRREPIPAAYRVFYRQIGLDPDVVHTPIEAAVLERMLRGGFLSAGLLEDVLLIALIDTCVGVWALDAASCDGPLGIRQSRYGEPLGRGSGAPALAEGRLVIADSTVALATLFEEPGAGYRAGPRTRDLTLFAIQVAGVPTVYVEEALWSARAALEVP